MLPDSAGVRLEQEAFLHPRGSIIYFTIWGQVVRTWDDSGDWGRQAGGWKHPNEALDGGDLCAFNRQRQAVVQGWTLKRKTVRFPPFQFEPGEDLDGVEHR